MPPSANHADGLIHYEKRKHRSTLLRLPAAPSVVKYLERWKSEWKTYPRCSSNKKIDSAFSTLLLHKRKRCLCIWIIYVFFKTITRTMYNTNTVHFLSYYTKTFVVVLMLAIYMCIPECAHACVYLNSTRSTSYSINLSVRILSNFR